MVRVSEPANPSRVKPLSNSKPISFPLLSSKIQRVWRGQSKKSNSALFRRTVVASMLKGVLFNSSDEVRKPSGCTTDKGRPDVVHFNCPSKRPSFEICSSGKEATEAVKVGKLLGVSFGSSEEVSLKIIEELEEEALAGREVRAQCELCT